MISAIQAEEMNMSIWLRSDGLSFAVYPKKEEQYNKPIEVGNIYFESQLSLRENIENSLYQQPLLALPYARVCLHYTPQSVGLAPLALYDYEQREVWETTICRNKTEILIPYQNKEEERAVILGTLARDVFEFLERSYLVIDFCPSYAQILNDMLVSCQTEGDSLLLLWLTKEGMTLAHTDANGLNYINRFNFVRPSDSSTFAGEIMYYISLVWQTLRLDDRCKLIIKGEQEEGLSLHDDQVAIIAELRTELEGRITNI